MPSANDIIARLELRPHPEGGYYREDVFATTRADPQDGRVRLRSTTCWRGATASHWHRIDAVEVWHYYAGSPARFADRQ